MGENCVAFLASSLQSLRCAAMNSVFVRQRTFVSSSAMKTKAGFGQPLNWLNQKNNALVVTLSPRLTISISSSQEYTC